MIEELNLHLPSADSPLPAWMHYEITRTADLAIQLKLPFKKTHKEHLIGLDIAYFVAKEEGEEETGYHMPFAKIEWNDEENQTRKTALDKEFLDELYNTIYDYIRENIAPPFYVTTVLLQVRTNRVLYIVSYPCLTIDGTHLGLPVRCSRTCRTGARRNCYRGRSAWICLHTGC